MKPVTEAMKWSVDSLMHSNHTPTWEDAVEMAEALAASDSRANLLQIGWSDVGRPIHALVLTGSRAEVLEDRNGVEEGIQALTAWSKHRPQGQALVLVNNAIHPESPVE